MDKSIAKIPNLLGKKINSKKRKKKNRVTLHELSYTFSTSAREAGSHVTRRVTRPQHVTPKRQSYNLNAGE